MSSSFDLISEPSTMFSEFSLNQQQWDFKLLQSQYEDISPVTSPAPPKYIRKEKKKRVRTAYTTEQIIALEQEFQVSNFLARPRREQLSLALGIPQPKLVTWFQNRRQKQKKLLEEELEEFISRVEQSTVSDDTNRWSITSILSGDNSMPHTNSTSSSTTELQEHRDMLEETLQILYEFERKENGLEHVFEGNQESSVLSSSVPATYYS